MKRSWVDCYSVNVVNAALFFDREDSSSKLAGSSRIHAVQAG
ncbi:hypothetical protein [Mycobacteroides abscessus]|nr:hypothetical protein [Mycobacteroides abscessus]